MIDPTAGIGERSVFTDVHASHMRKTAPILEYAGVDVRHPGIGKGAGVRGAAGHEGR